MAQQGSYKNPAVLGVKSLMKKIVIAIVISFLLMQAWHFPLLFKNKAAWFNLEAAIIIGISVSLISFFGANREGKSGVLTGLAFVLLSVVVSIRSYFNDLGEHLYYVALIVMASGVSAIIGGLLNRDKEKT